MEIPVQVVPCDVCRISTASGAALWLPFDRGLDVFFPADPQDPFVVDIDAMLFIQLIPDPAISHIRMGFMDDFDLL